MKNNILISCLVALGMLATTTVRAQGDIEALERGWKNINLTNVKSGNLSAMLERFDQTWPNEAVRDARSVMKQGLAEKVLDKETGYRVINDVKNGYVEVSDDGTDNGYMSACVWNRSNGHRLFAVVVGQPVDPEIEVVCFYDYNPLSKILVPEPNLLAGWKRKQAGSKLFYTLPKTGKNLQIREIWNDYDDCFDHYFKWDGMKPVFDHSERADAVDASATETIVKFKGNQPSISDFLSAILTGDEEELGETLGAVKDNWTRRLLGRPLTAGASFTVDERNGYIRYDFPSQDGYTSHTEVCYWNCADGKHKLVALNKVLLANGKPVDTEFTGLDFFLYDNATHQLTVTYAADWVGEYEMPEGLQTSTCALPRTGKNLEFTFYTTKGKTKKVLTWNGQGFK